MLPVTFVTGNIITKHSSLVKHQFSAGVSEVSCLAQVE